jgi:hypothetical protein
MTSLLLLHQSALTGVFTRRQAVLAGHSERDIKTRIGPRGDWVVVRQGVYATRTTWEAADAAAQYRLRVRAALMTTTSPCVASHGSAAALLGLPLRPHWTRLVHVTRPGVRGGRVEAGVSHHRAPYDESELVTVDGLPVLTPARTAMDLARTFGIEDGVVAADAAMRAGATRHELWSSAERMWSWPGVTSARAAADLADSGAHTIGESLTRLLVLEAGIGTPQTQYHLSDHLRQADVDLRVDSLLIEFDGRVKYVGRAAGGVADVPPEEVLWEEKKREDWLRRQGNGFVVVRVTWADLFGHQRRETIAMVQREHARAQALYGREA